MKNIELSIILPVYNAEKYINKCLESILVSNKNFEIILINDGSTDTSLNLVNNINDNRVKVYNNNNSGVSFSRNFGINKSSGKYIMFVDSDDYLSTKWDSIIFDKINEDDNIDVYYFDKELEIDTKKDLVEYITGYNGKKCIGAPFSKIFSRKFIIEQKIKFKKDLINGEDMLFNIEAALKMKSFRMVKTSFYFYRFTNGSATTSFNEKIYNNDYKFNIYLRNALLDKEYRNILEYSLVNGLYTILHRCSFSKNYKLAKNNYKKIDNKFYNNIDLKKIGIYKRIVIFLYFKKMYFVMYCIQIMYNKIRKLKFGKEYFKEI